VTPQYALGVLVGNGDGEGRPGITGIQAAAPLFFDTVRTLPTDGKWFSKPYDELVETKVSDKSGCKARPYSVESHLTLIPKAGNKTRKLSLSLSNTSHS